jgi:N-acetylneuraminate synthase
VSRTIQIGDRLIGSDQPAYLIAELSANHNGSLERALEIVRLAAESGADAIKLQTYTADTMTIPCDG